MAGYPSTFSKSLSKMGHNSMPKGRSIVGIGSFAMLLLGELRYK